MFPNLVILNRFSKSASVRVVSFREIFLIAKITCVVVTPQCLVHIRSAGVIPTALNPGTYVNLHLRNQMVALWKIPAELNKRTTRIVCSMGGHMCQASDTRANFAITNPDDQSFYIGRARLVSLEWINALLKSDAFIDPRPYFVSREDSESVRPQAFDLPPPQSSDSDDVVFSDNQRW